MRSIQNTREEPRPERASGLPHGGEQGPSWVLLEELGLGDRDWSPIRGWDTVALYA